MIKFLIHRIVQGMVTLLFLSLISFAIFQVTPGDPAYTIYGTDSQFLTESERIRINEQFDYHQPFISKFISWGREVFTGNLGYSNRQGRPVKEIISESLPNTLLLFSTSIFIILFASIFLGIKAGQHPDSLWDRGLTLMSITVSSIPAFWIGIVCIFIFSVQLNWLPSSGTGDLFSNDGAYNKIKYLLMPAFVLSFSHIGIYARFLQEQYKEEAKQPYVLVLKANGVKESFIVRGIIKKALSPYIQYIGVTIPSFFGGSIIIESLFNWAGIGLLSIQSILTRDYPLLMGSILITGIVVVLTIFITDVIAMMFNPYLRKGDII